MKQTEKSKSELRKATPEEKEENYEKMFRELLKKEIMKKVEDRIKQDDPSILKTIKSLIRDDNSEQKKKK